MTEMESLFRTAFSTFAPCKDDSGAVVPSTVAGRMWWQQKGQRRPPASIGTHSYRPADVNDVIQGNFPRPQGLYDPRFEHDACGIGFVVDLHGRKSHAIVRDAIQILMNLEHRGACGCEKNTGDGAGITVQMPHRFLVRECEKIGIRLPRGWLRHAR